jgi:hypothetical protein
LTSSEYSFSLDEQENLHDLFENISMPFCWEPDPNVTALSPRPLPHRPSALQGLNPPAKKKIHSAFNC